MSSFLQSPEWEKFQQAVGRKTWRVQDILLIRHELPFGFGYLYSPRPVLDRTEPGAILGELKKIAKEERSVFVKIEPETIRPNDLKTRGFLKSAKEIQPAQTIIINLLAAEEKIFQKMHEKTRYNIRLAQKHGIEVKELSEKDSPSVWKIFKETSERDRFFLHPKSYYEKMIEVLRPAGTLKIYGAFLGKNLVAASLMVFYGGRVTYLHGASAYSYRNLMAPYALHWQLIKDAKNDGFAEYDFWGVSPKYPGVSRFKRGFGGSEVSYPGSFDCVVKPLWYNLYRIGSKAGRILRQ